MKQTEANPNHPRKGQTLKIEPLRDLNDIERIRNNLSGSARNLLLFTMGINSSLRISDLLKLKLIDIVYLEPGQAISVTETQAGRKSSFRMNRTIKKALRNYLRNTLPDGADYIFASLKNKNKPLTIHAVNALVKKWTKQIGKHGNYGARTLRKTFGYIQRKKFGLEIDQLAVIFNHSNSRTTREYLGLTDEEDKKITLHDI